MRLFLALFLLLLVRAAEPRKGRRSRAEDRSPSGHIRGRGRSGVVRRQTQECKEYMEAGEKYLDCQDRQLTAVMQDWPKDIHHLLLARNKIQLLRDNMFARFTQLKSLDLQQNDIQKVEDGAFSGLTQLTTLLLQHNSLTMTSEEVFLALPRLIYLRLYDNPWSCRCQLDSLVRMLQVPSNRNLGNYAKCAEPSSLRGQKLKQVSVDSLCGAGSQEGGAGRPPRPPPKPIPSVCHTYMFPQPLLDCSSKGLTRVPDDLPSDIVKINLSNNSLKHLRPKQFLLSKDLKLLNLSSNNLQHIEIGVFAGLLHLRELDLSNNRLPYFQYGVLEDLYFLRKFTLEDNPWVCNYSIHYLVYWLKHHPGVSHTGLICSEPQEFRGWHVEDYVKTYNGDCPKDKQTGGTDTGQAEQGESDNEALETEPAEGKGALLPRPIKERPNTFEIIRLS